MVKGTGFLLLATACAALLPVDQPLKVTTRLVEVHVLVHDKQGRPVPGLTRDDFLLKDRGKGQKITVFSVEGRLASPSAVPALPPGVFSNLAPNGEPPLHSATVILLDKLNARVREQGDVRQALLRFLDRFTPQEPVAIVTFGEDNKVRVLSAFTTSLPQLKAAAASDQTRLSELQRMSEIDPMDPGDASREDMDDLGRQVAEHATEVKVERTLHAMEAIGRNLAHLPGRKSLVWFSDAFPFTMGYETKNIMDWRPLRLNFEQRVRRAMRVLTDANVAVYPMDSRGLFGVAMADSSAPDFGSEGAAMAPSIRQAHLSMDSIAEATGGKAFYDRNDLEGALREVFDDSGLVYVLGYRPAHDEWNGTFRPIEVRVKRGGLKVRCRRGYFAYADEPEAQRLASLRSVLDSPLDATALGLFATVTRLAGQWKIVLTVDARQLTLTSREDYWQGTLDVLFVQEDAAGKNLDTKQLVVPLNWPQPTFQLNLAHGARFNRLLDVVPTVARLRIVVRDRPSAALGSLSIPLDRLPQQ
jgi:VWFA-related protein